MYSIYPVLKKKSLRLATLPPCRKSVCSTRCGLGSGRVETSDTPDESDVLDAGDGVEGVGVEGRRRARRVWRVDSIICGVELTG